MCQAGSEGWLCSLRLTGDDLWVQSSQIQTRALMGTSLAKVQAGESILVSTQTRTLWNRPYLDIGHKKKAAVCATFALSYNATAHHK